MALSERDPTQFSESSLSLNQPLFEFYRLYDAGHKKTLKLNQTLTAEVKQGTSSIVNNKN